MSSVHRRITCIAICVSALLWAGMTWADDQGDRQPVLRTGAKALMFEIGHADLGPFEGTVISFKRHLSPVSALRFGLDLRFEVGDDDAVSSSQDVNGDSEYHSLGASLQYVRYGGEANPIHFYFLSGLRSAYFWRENERNYYDTYYGYVTRGSRDWGWTAGLVGGIGAEWFAARKISLLAEYRSALSVTWSRHDTYERRTRDNERRSSKSRSRNVRFGSDSVRFGLSVYF